MEDNQSERSFEYEEFRKKFHYLVVCKDCARSFDCASVAEECKFCRSNNIIVKDKDGKIINDFHPEKAQIPKAINAQHKPIKKLIPMKKKQKHHEYKVIDAIKINGKIYEIRKTLTGVYTYNATDKTMTGTVRIKPRMKDSISIEEITEKQMSRMNRRL